MNYLSAPYLMSQVSQASFMDSGMVYSCIKMTKPVEYVVNEMLMGEEPDLFANVLSYSYQLHDEYGKGGPFFAMNVAIGVHCLRKLNPITDGRPIGEAEWTGVRNREIELSNRRGLRTVEEIAGVALLEVENVNKGYVAGYREAFQVDSLQGYVGLSALGAFFAHDLVHFSTQERA